MPTSFLVFFLVFYGSQCYQRFFEMYSHCVGIGGATMQWVALVKLHLPDKVNVHWNAIRHILAAGHVEYYSLSGGELTPSEWKIISGRDLLTPREIETLKAYKGFKPFLPIFWGLKEIRQQLHSGPDDPLWNVFEFEEFLRTAFTLRGHCSQIVNLLKQPVPWPYFHMLNLLTFLVLVLVSYGLVGLAWWPISLVVHAIICLIFIGARCDLQP